MSTSSLMARALVAIALMIGFYVLAIGIAVSLLWIPYAELMYGERLHVKILIMCVAGAVIILWSILPRIDRFEAPGPELHATDQPELFAEIRAIAEATGQSMPSEVYAVGDVNAWVMQRGGIMGIGSRRVMGLGLPLMEALTVEQFRAVLAHEFGHYHGGDTRLGPWIYKTRTAIFRTVQNLAEHSGILYKPFEWYAKLFLRITEAISRKQELNADALAARVVSPRALAGGLAAVQRAALAYESYWNNEVTPVLHAGYRPAIAAGYRWFVGVESIARNLDEWMSEQLKSGTTDPYDSHPPLAARLAALQTIPVSRTPEEEAPDAITLLRKADVLETELLMQISGANDLGELKPLQWSGVGEHVWLPEWKNHVRQFGAALPRLSIAAIPSLHPWEDLAEKAGQAELQPEERRGFAASTIACSLILALSRSGWTIDAMPGDGVRLRRDGHQLEPFRLTNDLIEGRVDERQWLEICEAAGVGDLQLVTA